MNEPKWDEFCYRARELIQGYHVDDAGWIHDISQDEAINEFAAALREGGGWKEIYSSAKRRAQTAEAALETVNERAEVAEARVEKLEAARAEQNQPRQAPAEEHYGVTMADCREAAVTNNQIQIMEMIRDAVHRQKEKDAEIAKAKRGGANPSYGEGDYNDGYDAGLKDGWKSACDACAAAIRGQKP